MPENHAQRHWLNLEAQRAVEEALDPTPRIDFENGELAWLQWCHQNAIKEAAERLLLAENLHREIVRLGGTPL